MERVLVLCVDRDDDLGKKAGIKGPLLGREKNLAAAQALALADPADSDTNAMYEAIRIFDGLKKEAAGIVTLTGHKDRGYKADKVIRQQLDAVLKELKADSVYLVTDGADDDELIPIIQSRIKIASKKTLIVKQHKELEKSYYVIKEVLRDPAFARLIFGLPGIILFIIFALGGLGVKVIGIAVGAYLILKGFGLEDIVLNAFRNFRETTSIERASFPLYMGSLLVLVLSVWAGYERMQPIAGDILKQAAGFASGFMSLFMIAAALFLMGRVGDMHYRKEDARVRKYLLSIITVFAIWMVVQNAAAFVLGELDFAGFLQYVILAFVISIIGLNAVRRLYIRRYVAPRLKHGLEIYDAEGTKLGTVIDVNKKSRFLMGKKEENEEKFRVPFSRVIMVKDAVIARV